MLAIFIAGPYRYLNHIINQVDQILADNELKYEYFIHIWKSDEGNKIRAKSDFDINGIIKNPKVKYFVIQKPYARKDIEAYGFYASNRKDEDGNPASSINASYGMFYSMRVLFESLNCMVDSDKYDKILRLRTDTLIVNPAFFENLYLNKDGIVVPHNHLLGNDYLRLCDHIWFSGKRGFAKIWCNKFKNVYRVYKKTGRSPETALGMLKALILPRVPVYKTILRDVDYHIIYNPSRKYDPEWRQSQSDIGKLYSDYKNFYYSNETDSIKEKHEIVISKSKQRSLFTKLSILINRFLGRG